jgi:hypothetical protein
MERRDDPRIGSWLIGHLRRPPRQSHVRESLVERLLDTSTLESMADARMEEMAATIVELRLQLGATESELRKFAPVAHEPAGDAGHTFLVATSTGYEIVEAEGPAPAVGARVIIAQRPYTLERRRASPFPNDPRPCFVLVAESEPSKV